jgi:hypothetical protein
MKWSTVIKSLCQRYDIWYDPEYKETCFDNLRAAIQTEWFNKGKKSVEEKFNDLTQVKEYENLGIMAAKIEQLQADNIKLMQRIDLDDGKYIYMLHECGTQEVLRNEEPWKDITGDKFISCMAARIQELEEIVHWYQLQGLKVGPTTETKIIS